MDLSKLSAELPLSQGVSAADMSALNKELSEEFKVGARSIAALYRLSNTKTQAVQARGYLDCINDVLALVDSTGSLEEVRSTLMAKKRELTGEKNEPLSQSDLVNGQFTLNHPTQHHFPLTNTPMSITAHAKHPPKPANQNTRKYTLSVDQSNGSVQSSEESEAEDSELIGMESLKRKLLNDVAGGKKPRYDNLC